MALDVLDSDAHLDCCDDLCLCVCPTLCCISHLSLQSCVCACIYLAPLSLGLAVTTCVCACSPRAGKLASVFVCICPAPLSLTTYGLRRGGQGGAEGCGEEEACGHHGAHEGVGEAAEGRQRTPRRRHPVSITATASLAHKQRDQMR
eukprot:COSAG02_NODE_22632_length_746_cov_0.656878_2_plen_146_part_01